MGTYACMYVFVCEYVHLIKPMYVHTDAHTRPNNTNTYSLTGTYCNHISSHTIVHKKKYNWIYANGNLYVCICIQMYVHVCEDFNAYLYHLRRS